MSKQRRERFTNAERAALRAEHALRPLLSQKDLCVWFEGVYKKPIRQATVCVVLSKRFEYLDSLEALNRVERVQKNRSVRCVEFDRALYDWFVRAEDTVSLTGDLVKEKASVLWDLLPQTEGIQKPVFSNGWFDRFKTRFGIKYKRRHGEILSIEEVEVENAMVCVCRRGCDVERPPH